MMMGRYQQMERNKRRREAKEKDHSSLSSIREDEGEERESMKEERRALRRAEAELEERRMKNRKWREEKVKAQLLDEGGSSLFANLRPLLICQNCQGVGEDGEVLQCEKERHHLCRTCCNLSEEASQEVCPLCDSPIMGRHSFFEKVLALVQHGPTAPEQETTSFTFTASKKVELVSPELKKRGMESKEKKEEEEESEQKRRRGKREKVKEPSTVSITLTSEGEEEWDEVKRIEEEIEQIV